MEWVFIGQWQPAKNLPGQIEIIDLRCLFPLDEELVFETVRRHESAWYSRKNHRIILLLKHLPPDIQSLLPISRCGSRSAWRDECAGGAR